MAASNNTPKPLATAPTPAPAPTPQSTPKPPAKTETNTRQSDQDKAQEEYHEGLKLAHASLLGVNLEILKGLEQINFVKGTSGGMTNSAAYLKLWMDSTPMAVQTGGVIPSASAVSYPNLFTLAPPLNTLAYETNNTFVSKGTSLIKNVPISGPRFNPDLPPLVPNDVFTSPPIKEIPTIAGPVNSANPKSGGFWGSIFKSVRSSLKTTQITNKSTLLRPSSEGTAMDPLASSVYTSNGIWQFLFNPEEISVQGNAQYNVAEVWGVMDTEGQGGKNSGQPLQWRNNQNEKLVFSKILLNGYVFGRRVDGLEKGLLDLTRLAQAGNPDGPPVLKFVWGGRTFGPCVIREFNVREKNWDDGMLVNAEISLTLERVPEWIINDGFVDVARPGRQALIDDPTTAVGATSGGQNKNDKDQEGNDRKNAPANAAQNSANPIEAAKCKLLPGLIKNITELEDGLSFTSFNVLVGFMNRIDGEIETTYLDRYANIYETSAKILGDEFSRQFNGKNKAYTPSILLPAISNIPSVSFSWTRKDTPRQIALLNAVRTVKFCLVGIRNRKKCDTILNTNRKIEQVKGVNSRKAGDICGDSLLPIPPAGGWVNPSTKKIYQCIKGKLREI